MDINLRQCNKQDIILLQKISHNTYYETFRGFTADDIMKEYLNEAFDADKLKAELDDPESEFYFLYADNSLAGYFKINQDSAQTDIHDAQSLELERIYLIKEMQGKGLGQTLLKKAVEIAKQKTKAYIWLGVWEKNSKAIAFYQKHGFYIAGTHSFFMGSEEQTDHIMRKDIL